MPHLNVNGIDIHYREAGAPDAFPVVLIHGFTGNLRNWTLQIPVLTRRPAARYRTVSPDLRGHGHSAKPTRRQDYTLEAMTEDVYALLGALGIEECYLVGHSMGGMIGQHLTLDHPELVRALVLVDTAAEVPSSLLTEERAQLVEIARHQGLAAVFEEQLRMSPLYGQLREQPDLIDVWRQQFLLTSREAYIYLAEAIRDRKPLLDELSAIEAPTLIVCGDNDEPFVEPSRRMHERIGGSELVIIPDCGHTPQLEQPQEFNRILMGFLSRVDEAVTARGGV